MAIISTESPQLWLNVPSPGVVTLPPSVEDNVNVVAFIAKLARYEWLIEVPMSLLGFCVDESFQFTK